MSSILFLNRNFYTYDSRIKNELEKRGNIVYSYSLLPKYRFYQKFLLHISRDYFKKKYAVRQQMKILNDINDKNCKIDIVFVLAGQDLLPKTLEELKIKFPNAKFVWYMWDNVNKLKEYEKNSIYFDRIVSFDMIEAKEKELDYLPLFYIKEMRKANKIYDLCFVGADHSVRKKIIKDVLNLYKFDRIFIYLLSNKVSKLKNLCSKEFRECLSYMKLKELDYERVIEKMANSKCVLDIPDPNQTGLTMRTIETIGVHTKLITTNKAIVNYNFYNPENILVLESETNDLRMQEFLSTDYKEIDDVIVKEYSIEHWISKLCEMFIK